MHADGCYFIQVPDVTHPIFTHDTVLGCACLCLLAADDANSYYCVSKFDIAGEFVMRNNRAISTVSDCAAICDVTAGCDHFTKTVSGCWTKKLAFSGISSGKTGFTTSVRASCLSVADYGMLKTLVRWMQCSYCLYSSAY